MKCEWRLEGALSLGSTLALRKPGAKAPNRPGEADRSALSRALGQMCFLDKYAPSEPAFPPTE